MRHIGQSYHIAAAVAKTRSMGWILLWELLKTEVLQQLRLTFFFDSFIVKKRRTKAQKVRPF
jgi:hypothetical protein